MVAFAAVLGGASVCVALETAAFAEGEPDLVSSRSSTRDGDLTVVVTCPWGTVAAGVSAETTGFAGVTIDRLWPDGRHASAHAHATRAVTSEWTLVAQATCIPGTSDVYSAIASETTDTAGQVEVTAGCAGSTELVGWGWGVGDDLTLTSVVAGGGATSLSYPQGTGTGAGSTGTGGGATSLSYPQGTGTGAGSTGTGGGATNLSYPQGTGAYPGWATGVGDQTGAHTGTGTVGGDPAVTLTTATVTAEGTGRVDAVAVCANSGHGTGFVTGTTSYDENTSLLTSTSSCQQGGYAYAVSIELTGASTSGQTHLRRVWIEADGRDVDARVTRALAGSWWALRTGAVCSR